MTNQEVLLSIVRDGQTIYATQRSVSRSGMQRTLDFYAVVNGQIVRVTHLMADVARYSRNGAGEIIVRGCGFDAALDVIDHVGAKVGMKFRREWL